MRAMAIDGPNEECKAAALLENALNGCGANAAKMVHYYDYADQGRTSYQFEDYFKYSSTAWHLDAEGKRREDVFTQDCQRAYEPGQGSSWR